MKQLQENISQQINKYNNDAKNNNFKNYNLILEDEKMKEIENSTK